jgi:hypothetical protein
MLNVSNEQNNIFPYTNKNNSKLYNVNKFIEHLTQEKI